MAAMKRCVTNVHRLGHVCAVEYRLPKQFCIFKVEFNMVAKIMQFFLLRWFILSHLVGLRGQSGMSCQ